MKTISVLALCLLVVACAPAEDVATIDQCTWREIFFECLKSVPKGPTETKYNDWDEVVDQCDTVALYQSKRPRKIVKPECLLGAAQ